MKTTLIPKAKCIVHNGLSRTWRVLALFLIVNCQLSIVNSASAQEAFYIYRNDGDLNAFFFDEVKSMSYSKIDFEGVEHDKYVMQEVETKDSLYRIPLAVIDSIGFQQPDIILNPKLKMMDEDGLTEYIHIRWSDRITFKETLPESMRPQVGDVLVGFNPAVYGSEGFGVKVTETYLAYDGKWNCAFERVKDIGDLFVQFVSVEQLGVDDEGNVQSRVAGLNKVKRRVEGEKDMTILNIDQPVNVWLTLKDGVSCNVGLNVNLKMKARVVYNITWKSIYTQFTLTNDLSVNFQSQLDIEVGDNELIQAGLGKSVSLKFPTFLPLFEIRPTPEAFIRPQGHITATLASPTYGFNSVTTLTIDTRQPLSSVVKGSTKCNGKDAGGGDEDSQKWSLGLEMKGSLQVGLAAPVKIFTNSWASDILEMSVGTTLYIGPKLTAAFSLNANEVANGDLYAALENTEVSLTALSIHHQTDATFKGTSLFSDPTEETFKVLEGDIDFFTRSLHLFPDFDDTDFQQSSWTFDSTGQEDVSLGVATLHPWGDCLPSKNMGVAIYEYNEAAKERGDLVWISDSDKEYNPLSKKADGFEVNAGHWGMATGNYIMCPRFSLMGKQIAYSKGTPFNYVGKDLQFLDPTHWTNYQTDYFNLYEGRNSSTIPIEGLMDDCIVTAESDTYWLTCSVSPLEKNEYYCVNPGYSQYSVKGQKANSCTLKVNANLNSFYGKDTGNITVTVSRGSFSHSFTIPFIGYGLKENQTK